LVECTVATAALALAELLGSTENALTILESPWISEARPLAEEIAPAVWRVDTGTTTPSEFVVPTIVVVTGPFGPAVVITEVTTGGRENCDDGNGLLAAEDVGLGVEAEVGKTGGWLGNEMLGKPLRVVSQFEHVHTTPPEPTTMVVGWPFSVVSMDVTAVTLEN